MMRKPEGRTLVLVSVLFLGGCAGHQLQGMRALEDAPLSFVEQHTLDKSAPPSVGGEQEFLEQELFEGNSGMVPERKTDQVLIDSAMERYQKANDFWELGDLEKALEALDEAYALILKVEESADQSVLQQKEDLRFTIAKRIMEVYASRFRVANGCHNAIPLVMNTYVQEALDSFKTRERQFFIDAYVRSGKYRPMIVKVLRDEGLPEELSWLPLIESGFKVRALSRAGALGLWQFIASTGYKFGLERNMWVDDRMNPEKSTRAAVAYLKELHSIFGDWTTALAAYNCGEAYVLRVIREQKIKYLDNFWDLYAKLPYETASFVPRFIAALHIIQHPKEHGFSLPAVDALIETEEVVLEKQVHLNSIAERIGISYHDLWSLNPELRREVTPLEPYSLKVPAGKAKTLLARLDDISPWVPSVPVYVTHRVQRGDTLSHLASKYKTSVKAIVVANGLQSDRYIQQGSTLRIPTRIRKTSTERRSAGYPGQLGGRYSEYVVKKGDSLWTVASKFNTTTTTIQSLNQLPSASLTIGQVLLVPKD